MYIVFGSSKIYDIFPGRGAHDIIDIYENKEDAMNYVLSKKSKRFDWLHIYDTTSKKIIWYMDDEEDEEDKEK